ncbi:MAG TPA: acylphosphatase [Microvirga sp.]|nr:acylphosphatase [Microvirga sp.]
MPTDRIAHVLIHGRVQGVGFRAWIHHQAELHGLKGWVRNRRDGSVEAVFSGPGGMVEVMLKACHHGPSGCLVQLVEPVEGAGPELEDVQGFEIRRTV